MVVGFERGGWNPATRTDDRSQSRIEMADSAQSFIFIGLATLNIVISLDGGGVPAALTNIQLRFGLQAWQLGLLGSLVYVGQATGCLLGGPLLKRFSPTRVCRVMVCLNTAMTAMFASSQNSAWLLSTRFFIGLLQAPTSVYFPVWVDEYAPPERRTRWMALIQGGTPLGIMLGYAISGVMTLDKELGDGCHAGYIEHAGSCLSTEGWRVPFYVQSAVLVCFTIAGFFLPQKSFDLPDTASDPRRRCPRLLSPPPSRHFVPDRCYPHDTASLAATALAAAALTAAALTMPLPSTATPSLLPG